MQVPFLHFLLTPPFVGTLGWVELSGHRLSLGPVIRLGRIIPPGHQIELGCLAESFGRLAKSSGWVILPDHQIGLGCLATSSVHLAESLGCRAGCLARSSDRVGWSRRVVGSSRLLSSRLAEWSGRVGSSRRVIWSLGRRLTELSGRRVVKSGRSAVP